MTMMWKIMLILFREKKLEFGIYLVNVRRYLDIELGDSSRVTRLNPLFHVHQPLSARILLTRKVIMFIRKR